MRPAGSLAAQPGGEREFDSREGARRLQAKAASRRHSVPRPLSKTTNGRHTMMKLTLKTQNPGDIASDLLAIPVFSAQNPSKGKGKGKAGGKNSDKNAPSLPRGMAALDKTLGGPAQAALESSDFTGAAGQKAVVYCTKGSSRIGRIMLYGLGPADELDVEKLRNLAGAAADEARTRKLEKLAILAPSQRGVSSEETAAALAEGVVLGGYRDQRYENSGSRKTKRADHFGPLRQVSLVFPGLAKPAAARRARVRRCRPAPPAAGHRGHHRRAARSGGAAGHGRS